MSDTKNMTIEQIQEEKLRIKLQLQEFKVKILQERNRIFDIVRDFEGRNVVFVGGSGSGKSYEAADKVIDRIVYESKEVTGQKHRILCVRRWYNDISESMFPLLKAQAEERYPKVNWKFNSAKQNESITNLDNGNEIIFYGLDNEAKLKSIFDITSVWVEEADQILEKHFNELDRRLRGYSGYMQLMLTFNPVSNTTWVNKRFFKNKTKRTLYYRGKVAFEDFPHYKDFKNIILNKDEDAKTEYKKLLKEKVDKETAFAKAVLNKKYFKYDEDVDEDVEVNYYDTFLVHNTYRENKFTTPEDREKQRKSLITSPEDAEVYNKGQWGVMGRTYFNKKNVRDRKQKMEEIIATEGVTKGYFRYKCKSPDILDVILDNTIEFVPERS